ncbi:protein ENHANCED DOWNY MILDEW 2-like [Carex rostrata]
MASAYSSDEDSEQTLIPESVTEYLFEDKEESAISFSDLPYDSPNPESPQVYLRGKTEDKLQMVYQPAVAWKLEISRKIGPDVFVLSNGKWVKLLKPKKFYEILIRSILISIQALHFLRWNPNSVEKSLWDNLRRVFDKFEVRPSEDDFRPHIALMKQIAEKDETLVKSQLLKGFLEGKGRRITGEGTSGASEVKQSFIAEDDEVDEVRDTKGNESEEEDADLFDSVCSICDNGGDLLCCEGECMRSFHATEEAGEDSACESLGLTSAQVEATQNFLCKNCKVKQHQCFACGKLGNSDKSKGAEVFQCSNATCGYFYHPNCVAKLLHPDDDAALSECEKTVLEGRFACPYHRCAVCKKLEIKADPDLQFAVCRRCPKSYHRKCLPRKISFTADPENGIMTRAWEDLLPNRILIYCLKHKLDEELLTPRRDHIVFPETIRVQQKAKVRLSEVPSHKQKRPLAKRHESPMATSRETSPADRRPLKKRAMLSEEVPSSKGRGIGNPSQLSKGKAVSPRKVKRLRENDLSKEEVTGTAITSRSPSPREVATGDLPSCSGNIQHSSFPVISATVESKMKEFLEKESVSVKDVLKRQSMPQTHQYRPIEKVARGKIERSVEAIQTAYKRITDGDTVDNAKAVCEPEIVKQVAKWHKKLGVYLSPFLHGMRYTSFGRHFTKEEKLQEICCKLQWYVQTNDTIVDFCCGSNDFSRIMKEKMDALGKRCNFKNYDIVPPKDDFCYEKRDWMTVRRKELPDGDSLIMGLNPPFGTKAGLANKFIDKALTFRPKLVILIVPKETERLDQKRTPYDLVWVDSVMLSGMSFYLPGSVDVNDKQMDQWNVNTPLLYLWSRSDWTARHKAIAEEHGHFSDLSQDMLASPPCSPPPSVEEQKEAEDIISQVVGDISVINNEVMEVRQEDVSFRKGKGKVDPGPRELESQGKTGPSVMKEKEGKDVGAGTAVIEEVKGSLEGMGSHREARGIDRQNEGRGGRAGPSAMKEKEGKDVGAGTTAIEEVKKGSLEGMGSHREARGINYQNEGRGGWAGPSVMKEKEGKDVGDGTTAIEEVKKGSLEGMGSYREARGIDHQNEGRGGRAGPSVTKEKEGKDVGAGTAAIEEVKKGSLEGMGSHREARGIDHQNEGRGGRADQNSGASSPLKEPRANRGNLQMENNNGRFDSSLNRGIGTIQRENSSSLNAPRANRENLQTEINNGRYDSSSNRGIGAIQRENHNTASREILPMAGFQYNDPLIEQQIEMRQLDCQLDFSDLGPILGNGNDDFNDMTRQYPTPSSYDWPVASGLGSGSGSILEYNRGRGSDYMDHRGFDDFEGLGRLYGSHDENRHNNFGAVPISQPGSTFHNGTSVMDRYTPRLDETNCWRPVGSLGFSGLGNSTSTSAMDRYTPRLDETNILRPVGSLGFSGGSHQFHQGLGGYGGSSGLPPYPYDMHGVDRRDMPSPHPNLSGFGPRQLPSFQPPPGSSGGWLDD